MARNLLSDTALRKAAPKTKEYELQDGDGLMLRVRPNGQRAWIWRYKSPATGKRTREYLGAYPALTLAAARDQRDRRSELVARGVDPARATALLTMADDTPPETLGQLFERWYAAEIETNRKNKTDRDSIRSRYRQHIAPQLADVPLLALRRQHVLLALGSARSAKRMRTANLILAEMRQMFAYAVVNEWMQGDPSAGIRRRDAGGQDKESDRVLSDDELCTLHDVLGRPPIQKTQYYTATRRVLPVRTELMVWWTLATAARAVEVATIRRRGAVNVAARTWTIPAAVAKNKKAHIVHLNGFALAVWERIEQLPVDEESPKSEYVFVGRNGGHVSEREVTRRLTDRQTRTKPIKGRKNTTDLDLPGGHWTQHDLRRTAATIMGEHDILDAVIDRCLNHVSTKKTRRIYQRQVMMRQRQDAFDVLGNYLVRLLGDPSVWLPRVENDLKQLKAA